MPCVAVDRKGLALIDETVQGYGAFASCCDRVNNELLPEISVAADENIRLRCLQGDRIRDGGAVAVEFHLRTGEQLLPVDPLADAEEHGLTCFFSRLAVIEFRIEAALGVLDGDAFAEFDTCAFAVFSQDLSLSPAGVDHDAVFLAERPVFLAHGHLIVGFKAVQMDFCGALANGGTGNIRADVSAADHNDISGKRFRGSEVDLFHIVDACHDVFSVFAWDVHLSAVLKSDSREETFESLFAKLGDRDVFADFDAAADLDAHFAEDIDLSVHDFLLKTEIRDAERHHAAGHRSLFKYDR